MAMATAGSGVNGPWRETLCRFPNSKPFLGNDEALPSNPWSIAVFEFSDGLAVVAPGSRDAETLLDPAKMRGNTVV